MPIAANRLSQLFSRVYVSTLHQSNIITGLVDRRWEADARNTWQVQIPVPSTAAPLSTSGLAAAPLTPTNWANPADTQSLAYVTLSVNQIREINASIARRVARNVTAPLVSYEAIEIAEAAAMLNDTYMFGIMAGANTPGAGDGTRTNNSARYSRWGTDAVHINSDGDVVGNNNDIMLDVMKWFRRQAPVNNIAGAASQSRQRLRVVMPPQLCAALSDNLIDLGSDVLTYDLINGIGPGVIAGYRGSMFNFIDVFETNSADAKISVIEGSVTGTGTDNDTADFWQVVAFRSDAFAYAEIPPTVGFFDANDPQNPFGPYHRFTGVLEYGGVVVDPNRCMKAEIQSAAFS